MKAGFAAVLALLLVAVIALHINTVIHILIIAGIVLAALLMIFLAFRLNLICIRLIKVPERSVIVVYRRERAAEVLKTGWHLVAGVGVKFTKPLSTRSKRFPVKVERVYANDHGILTFDFVVEVKRSEEPHMLERSKIRNVPEEKIIKCSPSLLAAFCARYSTVELLSMHEQVEQALKQGIQEQVDMLGFEIKYVYLQPITAPDSMQSALSGPFRAQQGRLSAGERTQAELSTLRGRGEILAELYRKFIDAGMEPKAADQLARQTLITVFRDGGNAHVVVGSGNHMPIIVDDRQRRPSPYPRPEGSDA